MGDQGRSPADGPDHSPTADQCQVPVGEPGQLMNYAEQINKAESLEIICIKRHFIIHYFINPEISWSPQ